MGNNFLECDVADCNEHRLQFNSVVQFKTDDQITELKEQGGLPKEVIDRYGVIDTTLKDKCRTLEWKNAFIVLVMKHYFDKPVHIKQDAEECDEGEKPLIV
jgi:hypothetical protein